MEVLVNRLARLLHKEASTTTTQGIPEEHRKERKKTQRTLSLAKARVENILPLVVRKKKKTNNNKVIITYIKEEEEIPTNCGRGSG